MARPYLRNLSKERFWRRRLKRWRRSGQTIRAFCRQQGLAEPSFYAWRAELARRDQARRHGEPRPRLGHITTEPRVVRRRRRLFVPVRVTSTTPPSPIEIVTRTGQVLRIGIGVDPSTLRQVLDVLEGWPC